MSAFTGPCRQNGTEWLQYSYCDAGLCQVGEVRWKGITTVAGKQGYKALEGGSAEGGCVFTRT